MICLVSSEYVFTILLEMKDDVQDTLQIDPYFCQCFKVSAIYVAEWV